MKQGEFLNPSVLIGELPWIETVVPTQGAKSTFDTKPVARLQVGFEEGLLNYYQQQLDYYGIEHSMPDVVDEAKPKFLDVALNGENGRKFDALRITSTHWQASSGRLGHATLQSSGGGFVDELYDFSKGKIDIDGLKVQQALVNTFGRYGIEASPLENEHLNIAVDANQEQALRRLDRHAKKLIDALPLEVEASNKLLEGTKQKARMPISKTALTGGVFGFIGSIPVLVETYNIGQQEIAEGRMPINATTRALEYSAETVVGTAAGAAAATTALPLLAIPAPVGEIAYGAAVLGAGYLGAEATNKFMTLGEDYITKAEAWFKNEAKAIFEGRIAEVAKQNGRNLKDVLSNVYQAMDEADLFQNHKQIVEVPTAHALEP